MNVMRWVRNNASTILTCLGAVGVAVTVVMAIEATLDVAESRQADARSEEPASEDENVTAVRVVAEQWQAYVPTAAVGAASLACIFGANVLSRRQIASMSAAYALLAGAFQEYRSMADAACGPGTDAMIKKATEQKMRDAHEDRPPWDERQTFYIEGCETPRFFERTMEEVMQAEYHLNRNFVLRGSATLNEFLEFLHLNPTPDGEDIGWDEYIGEALYGYRWIDFDHRYFETDDGLTVCAIDMPFAPHNLSEGVEE